MNAGYTSRNTSRLCHTPPDLEPFLIFWILGHDLRIGSKSRNQSRTDLGEMPPEDHGPPLPQKQQGQWERPQEPKNRAGGSNLRKKGVLRGVQELDVMLKIF